VGTGADDNLTPDIQGRSSPSVNAAFHSHGLIRVSVIASFSCPPRSLDAMLTDSDPSQYSEFSVVLDEAAGMVELLLAYWERFTSQRREWTARAAHARDAGEMRNRGSVRSAAATFTSAAASQCDHLFRMRSPGFLAS
jgi:hypothetical protein